MIHCAGKKDGYWQVIGILIGWKDDAHAINIADIQGIITGYRIRRNPEKEQPGNLT